MSLEDKIKKNLIRWISDDAPQNDIVLSSRIRLARNLDNYLYPNMSDEKTKEEVSDRIKEAISASDITLNYIKIADIPKSEKELLVEKHLISPAHAVPGIEKGVFINDGETISIMVNEEDHLRIQILKPGMQLSKAWEDADEIDNILEKKLDIAFSEQWGYLSSCPTNVGTGLRASVMVHLPALKITNNINKMLAAVSQLGLAIRGLYGEGSESIGNIYQISNQITLGHSENDIIENLISVTHQIINQERNARQALLVEQEVIVKDKIKRSYGILKYAHRISNEEALELLSYLKLGIDMGIIEDVYDRVLIELMVIIRPAHIEKIYGKELNKVEEDIMRAKLIQTKLTI